MSEKLVILTHLLFEVKTVLCLSAIVAAATVQSCFVFFCATTVVCKRAVHFNDVCVARDDRGLVVESLLCVSAFALSQCRLIGDSTVR